MNGKADSPRYPSLEESMKFLRKTCREDFDGHTSFREMTVEQRIEWASRSARVVSEMKQQQKGLS